MLKWSRRLRPAHLFWTWCAYWVALLLIFLGPALPTLWDMTRPGSRGALSVSVNDGIFSLVAAPAGASAVSLEVGLLSAILWIGIPPLLIWALWLRSQRPERQQSRI